MHVVLRHYDSSSEIPPILRLWSIDHLPLSIAQWFNELHGWNIDHAQSGMQIGLRIYESALDREYFVCHHMIIDPVDKMIITTLFSPSRQRLWVSIGLEIPLFYTHPICSQPHPPYPHPYEKENSAVENSCSEGRELFWKVFSSLFSSANGLSSLRFLFLLRSSLLPFFFGHIICGKKCTRWSHCNLFLRKLSSFWSLRFTGDLPHLRYVDVKHRKKFFCW